MQTSGVPAYILGLYGRFGAHVTLVEHSFLSGSTQHALCLCQSSSSSTNFYTREECQAFGYDRPGKRLYNAITITNKYLTLYVLQQFSRLA